MRIKKIPLPIFAIVFLLAACTKNDVPKPVDPILKKKKVAESVLQGTPVKLQLYAEYDSLFVGYNPLYITLIDTSAKQNISNASISLLPVMDMITMKHSCPTEQPVYTGVDKWYQGAVAFIMATDGMMGWTITITTNYNGNSFTNVIPIVVKNTSTSIKLISKIADQNAVPHFIVLVHPQKPEQKVGLNDLEVAVFKKSTMMSFPAVDNMALSFIPTMPSMGHSSPNNVNPVFVSNGHYKGKVNFSMTGDWRLDFTATGNGSTFADHAILDVLF